MGPPSSLSAELRPAGWNELRCITRDVLGLYGTIVTIGTYALATTSVPDVNSFRDRLVKALKKCVEEHPVLHTCLADAGTEKPVLMNQPVFDVNEHLYLLEDPSISGDNAQCINYLLDKSHNEYEGYDKRAIGDSLPPQWLVYVVPMTTGSTSMFRFKMAFAFSHCLADGKSGLNFHATFLQALREGGRLQYDANPVLRPKEVAVMPPFEKAAPFTISWSYLLAPAFRVYAPAFITRALGLEFDMTEDAWVGAAARPPKPTPSEPVRTSFQVVQIDASVVRRALKVCRTKEARLTGVLHQLTIRGLSKALKARGKSSSKFVAQSALDLRHILSDKDQCMGNYVSGFTEPLTLQQNASGKGLSESEWETARSSTQRLEKAANSLADQPVALLRYLSNFRAWTIGNAEKPAECSYSISNVGRFDGSKGSGAEDWRIEEMLFSQSGDATGPPISFNYASAAEGPLSLAATWCPGGLGLDDEDEFMKEVCETIVDDIKTIAA